MTRINLVPPAELSDKHLVAEYRELPRVFRLAAKWLERGCPTSIPLEYTLGKGHVTFFYDKLHFIWVRHHWLCLEMTARGFTVNIPTPNTHGAPEVLFGRYEPTDKALAINRRRINERNKGPG